MSSPTGVLQRVLVTGFAWGILWLALWMAFLAVVGIVDPDSIDPGEGPVATAAIFGPMGLFTGIVFASLLAIGNRGAALFDRPFTRVVACGVLGTAIVQLAYLGHGDAGLAANIRMALIFSAVGGLVTVLWLESAKRWARGRLKLRKHDAV